MFWLLWISLLLLAGRFVVSCNGSCDCENLTRFVQAIMKSVFPASIDGDLLKLVHLSNGFRLLPGAVPLKSGDVCKGEGSIQSVIITDAGKAVKVKGHIIRNGEKVVEVVTLLLSGEGGKDSNGVEAGKPLVGQTVEISTNNHYFRQQHDYCDEPMKAVMGSTDM